MAYIPPLNGGRLNASLSGNSTSAGAGYSLLSTGTMFLAGGNNITLSQNGASITISGANAAGASINISASNASANLASVTFSNSNGLSFGLNAGVITASHNALTSQSNPGASASNGSFSFQTIGFSGGNGVTFGTSAGSIVSASVATSYAASNHSHGNPTLNLTNISGTTASASNGLTLSLSAAAPGAGVALSAVGNSVSNGTVTLSNSNGLAFGMVGSVITGSYTVPTQSNQSLSIALAGNTNGNTSGASIDARSITIQGLGSVTAGLSTSAGGTSLMISGSQSVQTQNSVAINGSSGAISITNGGNVSFGGNASAITASYSQTVQSQSNIQGIIASGSTNRTGDISFANSNGITFGLSNNTITASYTVPAGGGGGGVALSVPGSSYSSGTIQMSALGALTLSGSTNSVISMSVPAVSQLTGAGAITMASGGANITIGAPVMSFGMMSNTSASAGTGGNSGTTASNGLFLLAGNNITLSQTTGAGGATIGIYGTNGGGGGGGGVALYDGAHSISSGTASLNASGALTVSITNQSLNLSVPATSSLVGANGITINTNGSTISIQPTQLTAFVNMLQGSTSSQTLGAMNATSGSVQFYPVSIPSPIAFDAVRVAFSASFVSQTSSGAQTITHSFGLYSQNVSSLSLISSNSMGYSITNNSISGTISYATSTGTGGYGYGSTSANAIANLQASFGSGGGLHMVDLQFGNTMSLSPGMYWLAMLKKESSVNSNVGMSLGLAGNIVMLPNAVAPFGAATSAMSSISSNKGPYLGFGPYNASSGALPGSAAISSINHSLTIMPFMTFIST